MAGTGLRKFKFERQVGRTVVNPMVAALERVGIRSALVVELETTGRKSGVARRVPLTAKADDDGVWVVSQHGHRAGWAHNIEANPTVRVRVGDRWRTGTAAAALAMRALQSDPISVRITYTDESR